MTESKSGYVGSQDDVTVAPATVTRPKQRAPKCLGSTFDGLHSWRCERRTRNANRYCFQHQHQAPRRGTR